MIDHAPVIALAQERVAGTRDLEHPHAARTDGRDRDGVLVDAREVIVISCCSV